MSDTGEMNHVTPLIKAIESGHSDCVALLLDAGANPAMRLPPDGRTASSVARQCAAKACMKHLIAAQARACAELLA